MASGGLLARQPPRRQRQVGTSSLGFFLDRLTFYGLAGFSCQVFLLADVERGLCAASEKGVWQVLPVKKGVWVKLGGPVVTMFPTDSGTEVSAGPDWYVQSPAWNETPDNNQPPIAAKRWRHR